MMYRPSLISSLLICALTGAIAGCAIGPDYRRPAVTTSPQWNELGTAPDWIAATPADAQLKGEWWQLFNDSQLNALQQRSLQENLSLQAAVARLDQARALAQIARSDVFPRIGVEAQHSRTRTSANRPNNGTSTSNNVTSTLRDNNAVAATLNYEPDLFGRARRAHEASTAQAEQLLADLENIKLLLSADIATYYFQLRALISELNILDQSINAQSAILDIVRNRYADGAANGIDLAQQELIVANNRTQRELLAKRYAEQRHALATLIGSSEPLQFEIETVHAELPAVPLVFRSDLLQRRPDIAAAERAVAAANAQIGVAKSAWFPTLTISARDGFESSPFKQLFDAPSAAWSLGIGAAQTIFDGGATSARVDFANAKHRETVANYRATVLTAWQEVEDNLASAKTLAAAQRNAQQARTAANKIADVTDDRYQAGLASAVERYTAQQLSLNAQREEIQLTAQRWENAVALIKALGGGWHADNLADAGSAK